jgi:hypothetical protein
VIAATFPKYHGLKYLIYPKLITNGSYGDF